MRKCLKAVFNAVCVLLVLPSAAVGAFGRWKAVFRFFGQLYALFPGVPGQYVRRAYYVLTLEACSFNSCFEHGTFFAHREATVESGVYIGAYCILGRARIGANSQIASNVHILSGRRQHHRDEQGQIQGAETGTFECIAIGADCWIGTSAVIMADVGEGCTVGAGSVVARPIPPGKVAVGIPARAIKPVS